MFPYLVRMSFCLVDDLEKAAGPLGHIIARAELEGLVHEGVRLFIRALRSTPGYNIPALQAEERASGGRDGTRIGRGVRMSARG